MRLLTFAVSTIVLLFAAPAWADKVAVLPFTAPKGMPKPELDQPRAWTRDAVRAMGHTLPSDAEMLSADRAVADGSPDTSSEYRAAGKAAGAEWTLTAQVERRDVPPAKAPDGSEETGYTLYRVELEACQVETGRVESLAREIDPDAATAEIGEMLALLLRPEGIANAPIPWRDAPRKHRPKPKEPPPPPPPPPPPEPAKPVIKHAYAEGHPAALGLSIGVSNALARPETARGPSWAMPIGVAFGYAIEQAPGLELRGIFTSQVVGPRAIEIGAGARYAIPVLPQHRVFIGPELLIGAHVALGADKTARFATHGAAFVSWGIGERLQLELAGDLATALGGSGTLVLGGGTARAMFRF
ncbi:MAG: hypothetical protein KF819_03695 [Labilithrix sp.]|nr:hypothetical protein [Labilithrix sp.]